MVVVSGSWKSPSKTRTLTDAAAAALRRRRPVEITTIDLAEVGGEIALLTSASQAGPHLSSLFSAVASADLQVVGSPIFKAAYTGLFKHFFDLIDPQALVGTPVLLAATGGSLHYALVLEHQFRPALLILSRAHAADDQFTRWESDFENGILTSQNVKERIEKATSEAELAIARQLQGAAPNPPQ